MARMILLAVHTTEFSPMNLLSGSTPLNRPAESIGGAAYKQQVRKCVQKRCRHFFALKQVLNRRFLRFSEGAKNAFWNVFCSAREGQTPNIANGAHS